MNSFKKKQKAISIFTDLFTLAWYCWWKVWQRNDVFNLSDTFHVIKQEQKIFKNILPWEVVVVSLNKEKHIIPPHGSPPLLAILPLSYSCRRNGIACLIFPHSSGTTNEKCVNKENQNFFRTYTFHYAYTARCPRSQNYMKSREFEGFLLRLSPLDFIQPS